MIWLMFTVTGVWAAQNPDDRLEKLDEKYRKALAELATKYSDDGDVEAAHFFAECHRGLGKKDDKIHAIWLDWELKVYLGKDQGGKPLEKAGSIDQKLGGVGGEYKKIVEDMLATAKKERRAFTDGEGEVFRACVVKHELSRGAADYVRTIKRINELRRAMGLRGVLWDFENSRKLILTAACWTDVIDSLGSDTDETKQSAFYSADAMKFTLEQAAYGYSDVSKWVDEIRAFAVTRGQLLNPNARRLFLGHWKRLDGFVEACAYAIPQLPYREDIPTPSDRHTRGTVAKDWVDTEETFDLGGRKVPLVRYPHESDKDVPRSFGEPGKGDVEDGWGKSEHEFLRKAGVPVMLRFFGTVKVTEVETKLVSKSGKEIACRTYINGDDRVPGIRDWPTILLVPERDLEKGATYTVIMKSKVDGVPFEKKWSFTTCK